MKVAGSRPAVGVRGWLGRLGWKVDQMSVERVDETRAGFCGCRSNILVNDARSTLCMDLLILAFGYHCSLERRPGF